MAVDIKVRFVTDPASANYGRIVVTTTTDFNSSTLHKFGITGPGGLIVKAFPPTTYDDTGVIGEISAAIPLVTGGGAFLYGDYIFVVIVNEDGAGLNIFSEIKTWEFCANELNTDLSVEVTVDCYAKKIVVNDNTSYPSLGTVSRVMRAKHPVIAGETDEADDTTTTSELIVDLTRSTGIAYENITYQLLVTSQVDLQQELEEINSGEDSWDMGIVYGMTSYNSEEKVVCNFDPCKIISCVDSRYTELLDKACKRGGLTNLNQQDASTFALLGSYLTMYNYWIRCKDYDKTNYYYNLIKALVKDCDCSVPSGPQPIADSGVIYLTGPSAYDLWISEGNTGSLDDFFNMLYPVGQWIEIDTAIMNDNYEFGEYALSYRLLKTHIEFKGGFKAIIGYTPTNANPITLFSSDFSPAEVEPASFLPIFYEGTCVGRFFRDTDGEWKLWWNSDVFNDTLDNQLSGMLALKNIVPSSAPITSGDWTVFPTSAYSNSYDGSGSVSLQWRTDGRFVYIRGTFSGSGWSSGGFVVINGAYFTTLGITLEEGYYLPLIDGSATVTKGVPGYAEIVDNQIIAHSSSSVLSADFDPSHIHAINGIIPRTS